MTRLDQTKVGGYVRVIDQIARKSVKPFVIIFILLLGFLIAFRNRSVEANSFFYTMDHLNGILPHTLFQIYFMMAGDFQTENMGTDQRCVIAYFFLNSITKYITEYFNFTQLHYQLNQ
jgi:hypothetical protein